jgi:EAL domain-containing protein (putative c-di-GMP-specific phosphodiesterase class I)
LQQLVSQPFLQRSAGSAETVDVERVLAGWTVWPVFEQGDRNRCAGGVLWPQGAASEPFGMDDLAPVEAVEQAAAATRAALCLLEQVPSPIWVAVPVHPGALLMPRGWWRPLSRQLPDLAAARERAGARLLFAVAQHPLLHEADPGLLRNLAALHGLALCVQPLIPSTLREVLPWPVSRLLLGVESCAGIDCDQALQQQWRFLAHGAAQLNLPITALGVGSDSALAWLRRHGCSEVGGSHLHDALPAEHFSVLVGKAISSCVA